MRAWHLESDWARNLVSRVDRQVSSTRAHYIFADEVQFASSAIQTNSNKSIQKKNLQIKVVKLIQGVSAERGVEKGTF